MYCNQYTITRFSSLVILPFVKDMSIDIDLVNECNPDRNSITYPPYPRKIKHCQYRLAYSSGSFLFYCWIICYSIAEWLNGLGDQKAFDLQQKQEKQFAGVWDWLR